ncbi:hypothetical protein [Dyella subtropica]|uniref:hypothetical protein n=1 Tax=Dyella subtropica TaxID=2992127 RepID=UPI00225536C2|nr:hypothetical protein [Dyella subtropica]
MSETMVRDVLDQVIAAVVPDLQRHCRDPWHLIGSAAACLAGVDVTVADLDVLTSVSDAKRLLEHWQSHREAVYAPAGAERFRSHFARFRFPGLPVEVMGGLELNTGQGWRAVDVGETVMVRVAGLDVPMPSVAEQIRILESFGRPKDLQRAALLRALDHPKHYAKS